LTIILTGLACVIASSVVFYTVAKHVANRATVGFTLILIILAVNEVADVTTACIVTSFAAAGYMLFLPPAQSFAVVGLQNWMAFGFFLFTAIVVTWLSSMGRKRALAAEHRRLAEQAETMHKLRKSESSLRDLSGKLMRLQDEERRRIERDWHDSTGQILPALLLNLEVLEANDDPAVKNAVRECRDYAMRALTEVRGLSRLLHPPEIETLGLAAALEEYVEKFNAMGGIHLEAQLPSQSFRMASDVEVAIFRLVQESLTNIRRHSGAQEATLRMKFSDGKCLLEISDQGRGFNPQTLSLRNSIGMGLASMRERAREMGGDLEIESGPKGTIVRASLPVQEVLTPG